ncbi:HAD-IA family hydrolase [Blastococcus sp. Marseille-P5729]|uniref:HAD-IA family hydrolase n=1 Tax=Blastococcus sp. Marseille-P5729 TaxID=2086582 RepID=UPI000D0FF00A|nr:HAD-IA family hydrolase [Blastococcus sp. Marseille-P5729]
MTEANQIKAVLWDFGGVILSSPFEAFNRYESERGLPADFVRTVNTHDPDANAWARLERSELSHEEFDEAFAAESKKLGHEIRGADILALLAGEVRPQMVAALDAVKAAGYKIACLTNNVMKKQDGLDPTANEREDVKPIMARFDAVVESSKVGYRKPEPKFYETACELLGVQPDECVYLDDLGINLKPAKAMGMQTIKVGDPDVALGELEAVLGITLR